MTENKRFKVIWKCLDDSTEFSDDLTETTFGVSEVCDLLNGLNDENQQLRKFIMDLQNMIQFDVDNGIKTYPKTLSEYLANALKVMLND